MERKLDKVDDGCGWKPLQVAAANGHFEIVELFINHGAKADVIALHHAAARNYSDIVRFLLKTGIRDICLPCKRGNVSWCSANLHQLHHCFCETALHAAVSRGYLSIVDILLRSGNTTLECKHGSGRTPLMDAVQRNNTQIVERLLIEGANIEAECLKILFQTCLLNVDLQRSKKRTGYIAVTVTNLFALVETELSIFVQHMDCGKWHFNSFIKGKPAQLLQIVWDGVLQRLQQYTIKLISFMLHMVKNKFHPKH